MISELKQKMMGERDAAVSMLIIAFGIKKKQSKEQVVKAVEHMINASILGTIITAHELEK